MDERGQVNGGVVRASGDVVLRWEGIGRKWGSEENNLRDCSSDRRWCVDAAITP